MRTSPVTCIPVVALVLAVGWGLPANTVVHAQTPGPDAGDPPARVGRMARLLGIVSFHTVDQTNWVPATLNYPVTSGNAFWTEPSSAAEIDVGAAHLALDQSTEFNVDVLDDRTLQATQTQGALFLRLRSVPNGDSYRITTPRGVAVITQPGAYEVVAGDANHPTMVTVLEGAARIDSTNASLSLGPRQTGRIDGSATFAVSVGPVIRDPFLMARLAQEQQAARPAASRNLPPPIVAQMTGGYALNNVGDWSPSPRYGHIWYPPVQATWVPYRDGHWGYVAPWGWTWIDDAPWGFAPFHYGRWVHEGSRWGWIPVEQGLSERARAAPVYAPALVSFLGFGVAVTVGTDRGRDPGGRDPRERDLGERALGERGGRNSVGWIPLGPREAYVPPYRASDRYVRAVNTNSVVTTTNITNVTNTTTVNNFVNRGAATVVPMTAMTASQPIAAKVEPVNPQLLAASVPRRAAPVQPTAATMGVTPVVARQLNLPPAAAVVAGPAAPGPALAPPSAVTPVAVTPVAARPNEGAPRPNGQSDVRPAGKGSPRPVMAPESAAPLPLAAALPILRPPTPAAPAHPESGGTAAGSNAAPAIVPPAIVPPAIVPNIPPPARTAVTPPGPTLVGPAPVGNPPAVVSAPAPLKIVTPVPNPIPAATVPSAAPAPGPARIVTPAPGQTSDAPPAAHSGGPGASPARPAEPHPAGAAGIAPAPLPAPMIVPAVPARSAAPALVPPPVAAPPAAAVAPKPPPPEAQHVPAPPPVVAAPVQAKVAEPAPKPPPPSPPAAQAVAPIAPPVVAAPIQVRVAEPAPKPPPPPPPAAQGVAPIAPPVAAALHGPAPSPASPPYPVAPPEIMAPVPVPPAAQLTPPPQGALPAQAHPGKPENDRAKSPEKP